MKRGKRKFIRHRRRQLHVRKKIFGTQMRPRLCVYRSLNNLYAQAIDDNQGRTLCALSTLSKDIRDKIKSRGNIKAAEFLGSEFAKLAKSKGIEKLVFDRRHYKFHGRLKAFAETARKGGLIF
jgi:large subunit ribosomal protein L18